MNQKWYTIDQRTPEPGDYILAKVDGCKICRFVKMTVREGEGLGHINEWRYLDQTMKWEDE